MSTPNDPGEQLRTQIEQPAISVMPGSYDALSAMLAERAGFDVVFTSGLSLSASLLGKPDMGFMTASENIDRVRSIARAIAVPLVADMDTGYGNALNVRRTITEAMDAGIAGVILEDQEWPKRCGHMSEKRVVPVADHARRIRAAADVRDERDRDLVIIGRTDAREPHGLEEGIERGCRYAEAGADVVFVEAPQSRDELERIADAFDVPTFANMIEGGVTPFLPAETLDAIGFDIVVYPLSPLFAATQAMTSCYTALYETGTTEEVSGVSFDEFETVIDAETFRERERAYAELYDRN